MPPLYGSPGGLLQEMYPDGAAGRGQAVAEAAPGPDRDVPAHADIAAKLDLEQRRHGDLVDHILLVRDGGRRPHRLGLRIVDLELGSYAGPEVHSNTQAPP